MFSHHLAPDAELRPLDPWRAREFAAHVAAARTHLAPWLPWASTVRDVETARSFLQRYAEKQARDAGRICGIWVADVLVGGVLFREFDAGRGVCELGVWLAPEASGRGLVTRAARFMIDWAFQARKMSRVEWLTVPDNHRSVATAKRLGMSRDGVLRSAFAHRGVRHDLEVWAVLATDAMP